MCLSGDDLYSRTATRPRDKNGVLSCCADGDTDGVTDGIADVLFCRPIHAVPTIALCRPLQPPLRRPSFWSLVIRAFTLLLSLAYVMLVCVVLCFALWCSRHQSKSTPGECPGSYSSCDRPRRRKAKPRYSRFFFWGVCKRSVPGRLDARLDTIHTTFVQRLFSARARCHCDRILQLAVLHLLASQT